MESLPEPNKVDVFRQSRNVATDLLKRGAKMREVGDLAELILGTRYVVRHTSSLDHDALADWMGTSRATYYRRRARITDLTGVKPEHYPVDIEAQAAPPKVAMGLVSLA